MASENSVSSIPVNAMERRFRDNFKAGLQGSCGIMSHKLECTVCDINIQHRLVTSRNEHLILGVLLCNSCSHRIRLNVNEYTETNHKNWCHWCAQRITSYNGTKINLVSCTACAKKFCQKCIRKHSSRERRSDGWMCFTCNPNQHWYKLRALCSETLHYTEEMKKDLDNRRKRIASSFSAARRTSRTSTANPHLYLSPRVTTNISTSSSNVSAIVTVSSPMMSANVSVSLHHNMSSPNLLNTSFLASGFDNTLKMPSESTNQSPNTLKLDDGNTCVICLSEESRLACVPCGHLCMCETCTPQFETKFHHCPICRSVYFKTIKIYYGRN